MSARLTIFIPTYHLGGVQNSLVRLANGFARAHGLQVDFLAPAGDLPFLHALAPEVRLLEVDSPPGAYLANYLARETPDVLLTGQLEDEVVAVEALAESGSDARLFCRIGVPRLHRLRHRTRNPLRYYREVRRLRSLYQRPDGFLVVSQATGTELVERLHVPEQRVHALPNPVVDDAMLEAADDPCPHPWLVDSQSTPVILGVGNLRRQKGFETLIRAFALLRRNRSARLIILGQGVRAAKLLRLARRLGVSGDVDLPGFAANPYCYMRRAAVFALTSRWEGQPNVLIEAIAVGTRVLATDCVSGPREILADGAYGPLVPVDDPRAAAEAMDSLLDSGLSRRELMARGEHYSAEHSVRCYMAAMGLLPETTPSTDEPSRS